MVNIKGILRNLAVHATGGLVVSIVFATIGLALSSPIMNAVFVIAALGALLELFGVDTKLS